MIRFELRSSAKKYAALAAMFMLSSLYFVLTAAQVLAAHYASSKNPAQIKRAIWLDPGNANFRYQLGKYEQPAAPLEALPWLESAVKLNPNSGKDWISLAAAQQSLGQIDSAKYSLQRALEADPCTPQLAWDAAMLYVSQGNSDAAMRQFHTLLENAPTFTEVTIRASWEFHPDIDYLLREIVPPPTYPAMLGFLIAKGETEAAGRVWQQMFSLQQPLERPALFSYIRHLISLHDVGTASRVWQQAASMAGLQAYQPSTENLLVNGDFRLDILNGGFDWVHQKTDGVSLTLDPIEKLSSSRSLRMTFDGPGIANAGISEIVAVEPNTNYEFSAFYRAEETDGAGGMEFAIQDAYRETTFLRSEDLKDAAFWKKTDGSFTTGPDTELLTLRIVRVPSGSPLRGKLWIDSLRLVRSSDREMAASSRKESQ